MNTRDINIFNVTDDDIKYLDSITDIAYYGLNDKKVTDVGYRNSKYTKTFDLSLNFHELQTRLGINEMLIKPYKLNLYTKGSFFKVHRDTHLPGLVATLILILPTTYTGGEICFGDYYPETRMDKSKLRFIYFDIGVEHSISEVTSGHRISLVYNVLHPAHSSNQSTVDFDEMPDEKYEDMLRDAIEFCKDKRNILLGESKYRNDIFYKFLEDLKKKFEIIEVGVELGSYNPVTHNISDIVEVYDTELSCEVLDIEHGGHGCWINNRDESCGLKDMVVRKYKVEHQLFPLSLALRRDSMSHVTGYGNEPVGMDSASNIEYYAGYLINPSNMSKVTHYEDHEYDDDPDENDENDGHDENDENDD